MIKESDYLIGAEVDREAIVKELDSIISGLQNLRSALKIGGFDTSEITKEIRKMKNRKGRLVLNINRQLAKSGVDIVRNVVRRYQDFQTIEGNPPGETGKLEEALENIDQGINVDFDDKISQVGIMSKAELEFATEPERIGAFGNPIRGNSLAYYIYQNQAITPGGPSDFRYFIIEFTAGFGQVHEEDEALVLERIQKVIDKSLS